MFSVGDGDKYGQKVEYWLLSFWEAILFSQRHLLSTSKTSNFQDVLILQQTELIKLLSMLVVSLCFQKANFLPSR